MLGRLSVPLNAIDPERHNLRDQYAAALKISNDTGDNLKYIDKLLELWSENSLINFDEMYESDNPEVLLD